MEGSRKEVQVDMGTCNDATMLLKGKHILATLGEDSYNYDIMINVGEGSYIL